MLKNNTKRQRADNISGLLGEREMHVDYLQGYLFGKPCGKKEFYEQFVNSDGK